MPFNDRDIITVIDFGTDKICVIHGCRSKNGGAEVISFSAKPSDGAVSKGAIVDYNKALTILESALSDADKSTLVSYDRRKVYFLVSGQSVTSRRGEGSVVIDNSSGKIENADINEAVDRALTLTVSHETVNFGTYDSYFLIDKTRKERNPEGMMAERLDAYIHVISCERKRIEKTNTMLREIGFDRGGEGVFSAIAAAYGCLSADERERGVCLVDFGAGVCDYVVIQADGVHTSGVLAVGTDNIANDLAIGLELPFDYCKKFLAESRLDEMRSKGLAMVEYKVPGTGRIRHIPVNSFEKIIDFRLRETFSILREKLEESGSFNLIGACCVLCGGGAMMHSAQDMMKEVFAMHVRTGVPIGISGNMSDLGNTLTSSCASLGLLKYALEFDNEEYGALDNVKNAIDDITERVIHSIGKIFKK